ncbi:MAG TPA: hypothetical protein VGV16_08610 [Gammaproteobacteria bacterium]|nr:hypothetical protein [Gammaproteobacteria bacterium]
MPLTLYIPDFHRAYEAAGRPRLPALELLVARARQQTAVAGEAFLAGRFGLAPGALQPGPFMRLGDGAAADTGYWLCAEPVHLAPDRDQLILLPEPLLQVSREEADALAAAFDGLYGAEGWKLEMLNPARGYLRCPKPLDVATHAPGGIAGSAVLDYMPTGPDSTALKQLMNEMQMLFHTHPVNQAREEAGRPLINSLWFWGGGVLPLYEKQPVPEVMSDLPLLRGLARWSGREPQAPAPERAEATHLVGLAADDVTALERDWFAPLLQGLKGANLKELHLYLDGIGLLELNTTSVRRFWRKRRPLSQVSP